MITKSNLIILIGILFLLVMAGCAVAENSSMETEAPDDEPIPVEIVEEEDVQDEEATPIEYDSYIEPYLAEIYLGILAEKREEIQSPGDESTDGEIAILDVFGDETPELLYIRRYDDPDYFNDPDYFKDSASDGVPCFFLEILSYSEPGGVESVFNSIVFVAAGGGGSYCVYLSREGELMLYHATFGFTYSWGFWQVIPNQSLGRPEEYWGNNYNSDLAKLYYARGYEEEEIQLYKKNGEEISKGQHDIAAKEIMGDIDRVIFQDIWGLYERGLDDLWKDITPFEAECLTYAEAVTWLEAQ